MTKKTIHTIKEKEVCNIRVDKYLSQYAGYFTRNQLKLRNVSVRRNGEAIKLSKTVTSGDVLEIEYEEISPPSYSPQPVKLDIIYEDRNVVVVNKPQGMVVHPAKGNYTHTLVQGLLYKYSEIGQAFQSENIRPGIVHRLDKDTSGILIATRNPDARDMLAVQFRKKQVRKTYFGIIKGSPPNNKGTIESYITRDPHHRKRFTSSEYHGKWASTSYIVLKKFGNFSFVMLQPLTGRTHQLRVHMKSLGCPILGDPIYSRKDAAFPDSTLQLHAFSLTIRIPGCHYPVKFKTPLPEHMRTTLHMLWKSSISLVL